MLKGKELDFIVLEDFELETPDTRLYGVAPTAGRDDRVGFIAEVTMPSGDSVYVVYTECWYHYSCTKNEFGDNIVRISDEYYIRVASETTDFDYSIFSSYEEAKKYLKDLYTYYDYYKDYYEEDDSDYPDHDCEEVEEVD